jgi:hypothetical protein
LRNLTALISRSLTAWLKKALWERQVCWGGKMFKNRLLETLKRSKNGDATDDETLRAMAKIQEHKRLSSQEFQKVYDTIWQEGPKTGYKNPDNWRRGGET